MLVASENRKRLDNAHLMIMVGYIPKGYANSKTFTPAHCPHVLKDANIMIGGFEPKVDPDDDQPMKHEMIYLDENTGGRLIGNITNSRLCMHRNHAAVVLRNKRPYNAGTLADVLKFDNKYYDVFPMGVGDSCLLKEGDVFLVRESSVTFFRSDYRNVGPNKIKLDDDFNIYVCLPEFANNANAMAAFHTPGFVRELRTRIEMFIGVWNEAWDPATSSVVTSIDKQRKGNYRNQMFVALEKGAKKIRCADYEGPQLDETDSDGGEEADPSEKDGGEADPSEKDGGGEVGPSEKDGGGEVGPSDAKKAKTAP